MTSFAVVVCEMTERSQDSSRVSLLSAGKMLFIVKRKFDNVTGLGKGNELYIWELFLSLKTR
jgi:hypothetical protein